MREIIRKMVESELRKKGSYTAEDIRKAYITVCSKLHYEDRLQKEA